MLQEFYDTAYADYGYNSLICIGIKKAGKTRVKNIRQIPISKLKQEVDQMKFLKGYDYYITANSISGSTKRQNVNLYGLHNIVIDLDNHGNIPKEELQDSCEQLLWRMKRDGIIPEPTFVHHTGRGMQLWFCLEEAYKTMLWMWKQCVWRINCQIRQMLRDNPGIQLTLDEGTSKKEIGFMRLPGTYNTAADCYTRMEKGNGRVYTLQELYEVLPEEPEEERPVKNAGADDSYQTLNRKRCLFLEELINIRNSPQGAETRNNILFLYYNAAKQIMDSDKAKSMTQKLNQKYKQPLKKLGYIFKYLDQKGFLQFRNNEWFAFLSMTKEEKESYAVRLSQNEARDTIRREKKEERDEWIKRLEKEGKTRKEIGQITKVSQPTIRRILGKKNRNPEEIRQVQEMKKEPAGEITAVVKKCRKTIWNWLNRRKYRKQIKERRRTLILLEKERKQKEREERRRVKEENRIQREVKKYKRRNKEETKHILESFFADFLLNHSPEEWTEENWNTAAEEAQQKLDRVIRELVTE